MPIYFSDIHRPEYERFLRTIQNQRTLNILRSYHDDGVSLTVSRRFVNTNLNNLRNVSHLGETIPRQSNFYRLQISEAAPIFRRLLNQRRASQLQQLQQRINNRRKQRAARTIQAAFIRRSTTGRNNQGKTITKLSRAGKLYISRMMPNNKNNNNKTNRNKLPKLPRNFGTWYDWGNTYVRPDLKASFNKSTKTLTLNGRTYRGQNLNRMGLPKNWM